MTAIRCRNCGAKINMPEFHSSLVMVCPECQWNEQLQARRPLPEGLAHDAGEAYERLERRARLSQAAMERLRVMGPVDFERFCTTLLEAEGHEVKVADQMYDQSHALEFREGDGVVFVACRCLAAQHLVEAEAVENLAGALVSSNAARGIFVTTSGFEEPAVTIAGQAGIDLWDGMELQRRLEIMDLETLKEWSGEQ